MEERILLIAQRMKALREILDVSAADVAKAANITEAEYLEYEAGKHDFSFSFLFSVAGRLGVDIVDLMTGEAPRLSVCSLVKSGEGLKMERRKEYKYEHLAYIFKNKKMEPFLVTVEPKDTDARSHQNSHEGQEFDYVLSGSMTLYIDKQELLLKEGDAVYFDAKHPHAMQAVGGTCRFLAIIAKQEDSMRIFEKYAKADFASYEDFKENFKITVPEGFNFAYDVLDELAATKPDKTALYWTNDKGEKRVFSFSDMKRLSDKAANYLSSLGIGKGDKVMIILKRDWQFWHTIMALHKLGAATIPATHLLTEKDITYRVNAAGVKAIISTDYGEVAARVDNAKDMPTLKLKLLCGDREGWLNYDKGVEDASDTFVKPAPENLPGNDDIMLLYFTSGTTGMPKMVAHSFTYPLGHIPTAVFWQNVDPDGMHLTVSETGWAKSVWGKLYGQWLGETAVFVYDHEKFVPAEMLQAICDHKVTTFCAPPTIYRYFIKEDLRKYDFSHMKWASIAGEPLNPEVYNQFYSATGLKLMEIYGQTELTVTVGTFLWMDPKPGSMGKPSPLFDVDVVDETGKPCNWGEAGEIVVRTDKGTNPGMFLGYYMDEELTNRVWHDGMYHTGDVAWKDEEGYYWYVGRTDDVIKSSGYRIGPFEVESALMEHPAVLETAITGVPHPERGQIVKATIVLAKGYEPSEALKKELQEHVKKVTAPYKYPREIEFVKELPKTISGKIRRVELREKDKAK